MIIEVVLTAFVQTSYEDYTHMFKTVEIEIPDDGKEWHVCGEQEPSTTPAARERMNDT